MKTHKTKNIIASGLLAALLISGIVFAQSPINLKNRDPNMGPTVITSNSLEFDYKEFIALFEGNVRVKDPQFTLTADKMLVYFENTNDVKRVDAIGRVVLTSGDMRATCSRASYTAANGLVKVWSDPGDPLPVVTKGENKITGKNISVWLNEQIVKVESEVELISKPEKK